MPHASCPGKCAASGAFCLEGMRRYCRARRRRSMLWRTGDESGRIDLYQLRREDLLVLARRLPPSDCSPRSRRASGRALAIHLRTGDSQIAGGGKGDWPGDAGSLILVAAIRVASAKPRDRRHMAVPQTGSVIEPCSRRVRPSWKTLDLAGAGWGKSSANGDVPTLTRTQASAKIEGPAEKSRQRASHAPSRASMSPARSWSRRCLGRDDLDETELLG